MPTGAHPPATPGPRLMSRTLRNPVSFSGRAGRLEWLFWVLGGFGWLDGMTRGMGGSILAIGLTNLVALQAVLHMGVGLGLVPPTGVALPLVSYGRSNLVVTLGALGILMAIARDTDAGCTGRA